MYKLFMKKCLALCISFIIAAGSVSVAFAGSDIEGHWAEKEMNYLINKGVISGDASGIRPEDYISRAEFAKTVNKIFGFSAKHSDNFADVLADSWYYDDMLIAKNALYLTGDEGGNVRPDDKITRVEVSVIITRILELEAKGSNLSFNDKDEIPTWAVNSIIALNEIGLINGYNDNTFKPNNQIKRCEAFVMLKNANDKFNQPEEETDDTDNNINMGNVGGMSGGGNSSSGGSGSGSIGTSKVSTPFITKFDNTNNMIYFTKTNNASSYVVRITNATSNEVEVLPSTTENSADLTDALNRLSKTETKNDPIGYYLFEIKAIGKAPYSDSNFSKPYKTEIEFPSVPSTPKDNVVIDQTNDISLSSESISCSWDAVDGVTSYRVFLVVNDIKYPVTVDNALRKATFTDMSKLINADKVNFEIQSISGLTDIKDSHVTIVEKQLSLFGLGKGTINEPYKIINSRQFSNIYKSPESHFSIENDIDFLANDDDKEPSNFQQISTLTGSIVGNLTSGQRPVVRMNLKMEKSGGGLCEFLSGKIENLVIDGNFNLKDKSGSFVGTANSTAVINNCTFKGNIEFKKSGATYSGGIAGTSKASAKITNCSFEGTLLSEVNITGGIIGYDVANTIVTGCYNKGTIKGISGSADIGGISGASYGTVTECYNIGSVEGYSSVGGIAGWARGTIKDCFNSGDVINLDDRDDAVLVNAGGILGYYNSSDATHTIKNNYNIGKVIGKNAVGGIMASNKSSNINDISGNYYAKEIEVINNIKGITALKRSELKSLDNLTNFAAATWEIKDDINYSYPVLKNNPYMGEGYEDPIPAFLYISSVEVEPESITVGETEVHYLTINGDANASKYRITVSKDGGPKASMETESGGATVKVDIISLLGGVKGFATIEVVALTNDAENYLDSVTETCNYVAVPRVSNVKLHYTQATIENYVLTWDKIEVATGYQVNIKIGEENIETKDLVENEFDLRTIKDFALENKYTIEIKTKKQDSLSNATSITVDTAYAGGEGTVVSPYEVANVRHLNNVNNNRDSHFVQIEDIEINADDNFVPIGKIYAERFRGTYIGKQDLENGIKHRKVIFKNYTAPSEITTTGLFGTISNDTTSLAIIENIGVEGSITGTTNVGGIAGANTGGTIKNCYSSANIIATGNYAGGIVGDSRGIIENCYSSGNVTAADYAGGIAGVSPTGRLSTISKCYATGNIKVTVTGAMYAAGILGASGTNHNQTYEMVVTISNCYFTGSYEGSTRSAGIIGLGADGRRTGPVKVTITQTYVTNSDMENKAYGMAVATGTNSANKKVSMPAAKNFWFKSASNTQTYTRSTAASLAELTGPTLSDVLKAGEFSEDVWEFDTTKGYGFPQLKSNPHVPTYTMPTE